MARLVLVHAEPLAQLIGKVDKDVGQTHNVLELGEDLQIRTVHVQARITGMGMDLRDKFIEMRIEFKYEKTVAIKGTAEPQRNNLPRNP